MFDPLPTSTQEPTLTPHKMVDFFWFPLKPIEKGTSDKRYTHSRFSPFVQAGRPFSTQSNRQLLVHFGFGDFAWHFDNLSWLFWQFYCLPGTCMFS